MVATLSSQGQLLLNIYLLATVILIGLILAQSWLRGITRQGEIDALSDQISTLDTHLKEAIATIETQRAEIQNLQHQVEGTNTDYQTLKSRYQTLQSEHDALTEKLTTLTASRDALAQELTEKKAEIEDSWLHTMTNAPQAFLESLPFMPKFDSEHKS